MPFGRNPSSTSAPVLVCALAFAGSMSLANVAVAQTTQLFPVRGEEVTPIGALPPIALPMPASRDQNYWGLRLQYGQRRERGGPEDLMAIAGGIDYQLRGGSIFGITGGHQWRQNCQVDCGGHNLFGARARFNLITGGPTISSFIGDESATTTLGTEVGFGYAPKVAPGANACTLDVGAPFSISMLERIRLVTFVTPGFVWDLNCSHDNTSNRSFFTGFGFGIQQLFVRGLDVHFGAQRIFRGSTGLQYGVSVSWVRLP